MSTHLRTTEGNGLELVHDTWIGNPVWMVASNERGDKKIGLVFDRDETERLIRFLASRIGLDTREIYMGANNKSPREAPPAGKSFFADGPEV